MEIKINDNLKKLAELLDKKLYIVGGAVRNTILNLPFDDIDICSPFLSEYVQKVCSENGFKSKVVNEKLGTLLITDKDGENYEYTPFRRENYLKGNHLPESVEFVDDILVDARRRDFTCNAVYCNVFTGEIVDPYNGIKDIDNKVVRCVETPLFVFSSDGLRLLRLVRFACELGFKIDAKTFKTASEMVYQLKDISAERKLAELNKIVVADFRYNKTPNEFLRYFNYLGIYKYLLNTPCEEFKIKPSGDEYNNYFSSKSGDRLLGFFVLFLLNKYGFKYISESQVNCDAMMLFNTLRLSGEMCADISRTYLVLQSLKFKPLNVFTAVNYHNLTARQRNVVNLFCDVKPVSELILNLKMSGIPLSPLKLAVLPEEIKEYVPENKISAIQKLLFEMCLTGRVKNEKDGLIKVLKSIKVNK